ncbi:hypothetical protein [Burkholderia cepacia]|uniref:hypothetical protein n=1 Tax=Burkholderia cepacia TaxID=292 RepID=UPI0012D911F4|nr:hypothetical protein [Burkholderia cepacia]
MMKLVNTVDTLADHVIALLSDDGEWTLSAMHEAIGSSVSRLRRAVRSLVKSGLISVCGAVGPQHAKKYRLMPEVELDRRCRDKALWWPTADSILSKAMFTMVRIRAVDTRAGSPE